MDDFKLVIEGKEYSCTKCGRVSIELDNTPTRSDIDFAEVLRLCESFRPPKEESLSCTMSIEKGSPEYERANELFEKLRKECEQKKKEEK